MREQVAPPCSFVLGLVQVVLDQPKQGGRRSQQAAGDVHRVLAQLLWRQHLVYHAELEGAGGRQLLVKQVQPPRQGRSADRGPEERAAIVAGQSVGGEVGREDRVAGGESEVARRGQAAARAHGGTAHH